MCLTLTTKHPLCGCLTTTTFTPCRLVPWNRCLRCEMIIVEGTRRRGDLLCEVCRCSGRYSERRMNRLYTLMGCLEGFDSGIEFDCLDIEEDQHEEDHGVEEIGGVVHDGHRNLVVDDCLLDDEEEEGSSGSEDSCLSGEVVGDGSSEEGVWYGEEEYGEEEEYIEESSEEELVVLRCDLSRVCDSIASSRVCHGSGLVELGREKKRRFGRGRVRGPRRRNTADEEAMEMDMAMARARVEDERISISTFSSG